MSGTKKKNNMASKIENKKNIMDPYDENYKLLKDPPPPHLPETIKYVCINFPCLQDYIFSNKPTFVYFFSQY